MNHKRKRENKGSAPWMASFADMVTLILVFFIILFSMSQIDAERFRAVAESFQQRAIFEFFPSAIPLEYSTNDNDGEGEEGDTTEFPSLGEDDDQESEDVSDDSEGQVDVDYDELASLLEEIERYLEQNGLSNVISANRTDRGVVLVLQERVLFETARAEIIDEAVPFLNKVGTLLDNINNYVKVEGHTDSRPINTFQYPSNWELSAARASSVVRYFIEDLDLEPARFQAVGFSDTRPIAENDGPENWQKNRRVEIIILDAKVME